ASHTFICHLFQLSAWLLTSFILLILLFFFFYFFFSYFRPLVLHSFPTRRSSDLSADAPARRGSSSSAPANGRRLRSASSCCSTRSEEHTSELQSHLNLVCRLLLEKKKINVRYNTFISTFMPVVRSSL